MMYFTKHASERIQQRGCTSDAVKLVMMVADRFVHLRNGLAVVSLSRSLAQNLIATGFANSVVSRASKICLVVNEDTRDVVTVLKSPLSDNYRAGAGKHRRGGKRNFEARR